MTEPITLIAVTAFAAFTMGLPKGGLPSVKTPGVPQWPW